MYRVVFYLCLVSLASCRSVRTIDDTTDHVSSSDLCVKDSLSSSLSLTFDELDLWIMDPDTLRTHPSPHLKEGIEDSRQNNPVLLKHLRIRNGTLHKEQERMMDLARQDSSRTINHSSFHHESSVPPDRNIMIILFLLFAVIILLSRR